MSDTICPTCKKPIALGAWPFCPHSLATTARSGEWSDKDAVVVYRTKAGAIRYPGRNDLPTPKDCERIVMRSLRQVQQFEREHGVSNEMVHFDKGSGRGFDDTFRGKPYDA